jgi:hypothetical protein
MDSLTDFLNWAWARHLNPLSWYIRPLFILPFCCFAYRKSARGGIARCSANGGAIQSHCRVTARAASTLRMA